MSVALVGVCTVAALRPARPRHSNPSSWSFRLGFLVNELPFVAGYWLVHWTVTEMIGGDLATPVGAAGAVLALGTVGLLAMVVRRALSTDVVVDAALQAGLGGGEHGRTERRRPWGRILAWPYPWLVRRGVQRVRNVPYGPERPSHLLDVHRPRRGPAGGPVFVHFHGGGFRGGRKNLDAQPLVNRLVARGWTCISANYRLSPGAVFPDQLVDAKRVIAWVRAHAGELGVAGSRIVVAGSSAGGRIAATAALTPCDPQFQPGFGRWP